MWEPSILSEVSPRILNSVLPFGPLDPGILPYNGILCFDCWIGGCFSPILPSLLVSMDYGYIVVFLKFLLLSDCWCQKFAAPAAKEGEFRGGHLRIAAPIFTPPPPPPYNYRARTATKLLLVYWVSSHGLAHFSKDIIYGKSRTYVSRQKRDL